MERDFKKNYIEEQKMQAVQRQSRLAKIGIGNVAKSAPKASGNGAQSAHPNRADVQRALSSQRHVPEESVAASQRTVTIPTPRPAQRPAVPARPVKVQPPAAPRRPSAPVKSNEIPLKNPENISTKRSAGVNTAAKRVASPNTPEGRVNTNVSKAPAKRERRVSEEEKLFSKEITENDSRAMMFALTGRAEEPDNGGDVDIINIGMIPAPKKDKPEKGQKKSNVGKYIGRTFASIGSFLLFVIIVVFSSLFLVAHGPSTTVRDILVQSAMQASATKWVPYIFLPGETVDAIVEKSEEVVKDVISYEEYTEEQTHEEIEDKWANAKDGMIFETVNGSTYKAYVLLVKDPTRVFVGTSSENYSTAKNGKNVFQAAQKYSAVACINGGEFSDNGGMGSGAAPMGLTYSKGECVWNDGLTRTFLGFDKNNKLIVRETMTKAEADSLGIRDGVSFQNGNTLISREGDNIEVYYRDGNLGTAQRTAIGQCADGTVILIVTDGRSANSLGATPNDIIDLMISYGAVSAGMLDGGSSSTMFYEDYFNKYNYDKTKLDKYQLQGLVNNYKAFTEPRYIPTFFMVEGE